MAQAAKAFVVFVTCPTKRQAEQLAARLVREHLAACVNVVPLAASYFRWQGKLERARELLLIIKTSARSLRPLRQAIVRYHSYDVPEVIAWPIAEGHPPYLRWVQESTASAVPRRRLS